MFLGKLFWKKLSKIPKPVHLIYTVDCNSHTIISVLIKEKLFHSYHLQQMQTFSAIYFEQNVSNRQRYVRKQCDY